MAKKKPENARHAGLLSRAPKKEGKNYSSMLHCILSHVPQPHSLPLFPLAWSPLLHILPESEGGAVPEILQPTLPSYVSVIDTDRTGSS